MIISLVYVFAEIRNGQVLPHGYQLSLTDDVSPEHLDADTEDPRIKKYCETLARILKNSKKRSLTIDFGWDRAPPNQMWVRLTGELLETLTQLCGNETKLNIEGNFGFNVASQNFRTCAEFKTAKLEISLPSNAIGQRSTVKAEIWKDKEVPVPENISTNNFSRFERNQINIYLSVEDEYLGMFEMDVKPLLQACEIMQEQKLHTDASIISVQTSDRAFSTNKCFLSVLRALLQSGLKESKTDIIELDYSVECIKSLLDFFYTSDFPEAVKSSTLALDLFKATNYYQIIPLEGKLVEMFLLRANSWFDANVAIELFRLASKIGIQSSSELKKKAVQVLKSKGDPRKFASLRKLFAEDWDVALELAATAIEN